MQPANRPLQPDTPAPATPKLLLTPQEAADALGIHRATLYELLMSGEIASISIGRARRIAVATLEAWIAGKLGTGASPTAVTTSPRRTAARQKGGEQDG